MRIDALLASIKPRLDAQRLLEHVLGKTVTYFVSHPEEEVPDEQVAAFLRCVAERRTGKPIPYITHTQEFYGLPFYVDERVLIPRPETELLINEAIAQLKKQDIINPYILDVGTGSGCIAITLQHEYIHGQIVATDLSADALTVARKNDAALLHDSHIDWLQSDLFSALTPQQHHAFDLIVSNPPYVDLSTVDLYSRESQSLRFEPRMALEPQNNDDHFAIIEQLITQSPQWLAPHGSLLVEIGYDHGPRALELAKHYFEHAHIKKDLGGFDRLLIARHSTSS